MKSHVSMEQQKCIVCVQTFDTGTLLIDRRLQSSMELHTVTGWGTCPDCEQKYKDGYIALVGCDEAKSERMHNGNVKPEDAYRTGLIVHIRLSVFESVFNVPVPMCDGKPQHMAFVDDAVIHALEAMTKK